MKIKINDTIFNGTIKQSGQFIIEQELTESDIEYFNKWQNDALNSYVIDYKRNIRYITQDDSGILHGCFCFFDDKDLVIINFDYLEKN